MTDRHHRDAAGDPWSRVPTENDIACTVQRFEDGAEVQRHPVPTALLSFRFCGGKFDRTVITTRHRSKDARGAALSAAERLREKS